MLSYEEREKLRKGVNFMEQRVGFDCEGKVLKVGDSVEVVKDARRSQNPNFHYCGVGKQGVVKSWVGGWIIVVDFGDGKTVGCVDYFLRKIL